MIRKALRIYLSGFLFGVLSASLLITFYPEAYYAFLRLLLLKIELQSEIIKDLSTLVILNNLVASYLCAFGGYFASKFLLYRGVSGSPAFLKRFKSIKEIPERYRMHYLSLSIFPIFMLFENGFVLGKLFIFYMEFLGKYVALLYPHALFEIPGMILAGAIGLEIATSSKASFFGKGGFPQELDSVARGGIKRYLIAVALLIIAGMLEGGTV